MAQLRAGSGSSGGSGGSGGGSSSNFNAAERALLEGVPERFHGRCQPLRSGWPFGTEAAVSCRPNTNRVTEMTYYLMESGQAVDLFDINMSAAGVPRYGDIIPVGTQLCDETVPSAIAAGGGYIGMEGCYRESGKAQLHIVEQLTSCRQLEAGSRWIERPAMYVELTGPSADIAALHTWANRLESVNLTPLIVPIVDGSAPATPDCFTP